MNTIRSNPKLLLQYNKIEEQVKEYKRLYSNNDPTKRLVDPNGFITIQVVVHIIHRAGEAIGVGANLAVAQVQSQIDVLNEDFSRTNPDVGQTPNAFAGVASNPTVRFELACTTPDGLGATNGITRTASGTANFSANREGVKFTNQGGIDAWATNRYLNIWVAPNLGNVLGFAQPLARFAAEPNTDGVVIVSNAFGRGAGFTLNPQYNLGRTATHEVGHWLNLIHIWGPNNGNQPPNCNDTDECNDTPNQSIENFGIPAATQASCGNGGDMFMNYMDYTDDVVMNLFTNDQRARMRALFMPGGLRASFIDNYFRLEQAYASCSGSGGFYVVRTPFCGAQGNINWSVSGPATLGSPNSHNAWNNVLPQSGANGIVTVTASWNNFAADYSFVLLADGLGAENSYYNPNYYGSTNRQTTKGSVNMTSYNNWTTGQISFAGATGLATNWRLVSNTSSNNTNCYGNTFGIYLTQPYQFETLRADIPTACGYKTVEYSFLGGYLNPRYGISPNPASNSITISATGLAENPNARVVNPTAYEVQIFNSYSQLIKKTTCPRGSNDIQVDISRFPSNQFYTVKLISDNDVQTKSFFKQ